MIPDQLYWSAVTVAIILFPIMFGLGYKAGQSKEREMAKEFYAHSSEQKSMTRKEV